MWAAPGNVLWGLPYRRAKMGFRPPLFYLVRSDLGVALLLADYQWAPMQDEAPAGFGRKRGQAWKGGPNHIFGQFG